MITRSTLHRTLLATAGLCLLAKAAVAAPPGAGADPDWPCEQPLVPSVSAEMIWDGPPLADAADWRSESAVAALVGAISPRDVPVEDGTAAIGRFLRTVQSQRTRSIKRAVAGLLEENNAARTRVITYLKSLAERQRGLADKVAELAAERDKAGKDASPDLLAQWTLTQRTYYEMQRTMRYACEVPAQLDQRLGLYARTLQAGLHGKPL